jgi:hypothetical protein
MFWTGRHLKILRSGMCIEDLGSAEDNVKARLDRVHATNALFELFPSVKVEILKGEI